MARCLISYAEACLPACLPACWPAFLLHTLAWCVSPASRLPPPPTAAGGRSVLTTIHQPSSRLFQQMDKLLLLSQASLMLYIKHIGFAYHCRLKGWKRTPAWCHPMLLS